jgi:hypothetical protein
MINKKYNFVSVYQTFILTFFFIMLIWDVIFPSNMMVLVLLLLSLIPVLLNSSRLIYSAEIRYFIFILAFFLIISFRHYVFDFEFSDTLFISNFSNLILSLQLLWILPILFYNNKKAFLKAVDLALYILGIVFIIQFITFYISGSYLDVLNFFAGRESKYMAYNSMLSQTGLNLIRPTSIFNEPGTYCSYSFILVAVSYLNHKKVGFLHLVILLTYMLSLSAFGILIASISFAYLFFLEYKKRKVAGRGLFKFIILTLPFVFIVLFFLVNYYVMRFLNDSTGGNGGLELRYNTYDIYMSNPFEDRLLGFSFGYNQIENYFIQDTSLFFSMLLYLGIFSLILLLSFMSKFKFNFQLLVFFILICSTKIDLFSFSFWFFISSAPLVYFYNLKSLMAYEK